jgi:hypothetical protein
MSFGPAIASLILVEGCSSYLIVLKRDMFHRFLFGVLNPLVVMDPFCKGTTESKGVLREAAKRSRLSSNLFHI